MLDWILTEKSLEMTITWLLTTTHATLFALILSHRIQKPLAELFLSTPVLICLFGHARMTSISLPSLGCNPTHKLDGLLWSESGGGKKSVMVDSNCIRVTSKGWKETGFSSRSFAMFQPICQEIVLESSLRRMVLASTRGDCLEYDEVSVEMLWWESVLCHDVLLSVMFAASCDNETPLVTLCWCPVSHLSLCSQLRYGQVSGWKHNILVTCLSRISCVGGNFAKQR